MRQVHFSSLHASQLHSNKQLNVMPGSRFWSPTRSPSTFSSRRPQRQQHAKRNSSPFGAVHAVVGMLSGTVWPGHLSLCVLVVFDSFPQRRLRARQQEAWQDRCPVALVSAADLLAFGCLMQFEAMRDSGKQRVLDTMEKIAGFRKEFVIVFLSHHWLAWTSPDPHGVHHKTMMAAVDQVPTWRMWASTKSSSGLIFVRSHRTCVSSNLHQCCLCFFAERA